MLRTLQWCLRHNFVLKFISCVSRVSCGSLGRDGSALMPMRVWSPTFVVCLMGHDGPETAEVVLVERLQQNIADKCLENTWARVDTATKMTCPSLS